MIGNKLSRLLKMALMVVPLMVVLSLTGCPLDGDDGDDVNPVVVNNLHAQIDDLQAQLDAAEDPAVVGSLQAQIDLLEEALAALDTDETCTICHGAGREFDVALKHPENIEALENDDLIAMVTAITDDGARILTVAFSVEDQNSDPVEGLTYGDFRFYLSDIVPAGTVTPWGTWDSDYLERWAYEREDTTVPITNPQGTLVDLTGGDYTYEFATAADPTATSTLDGTGAPENTVLEEAPDFDTGHTQRLVARISGPDGYHNGVLIQDFDLTVAPGAQTLLDPQRVLAPTDGCKNCHSDQMLGAAHAGSYLDTRACVMCHSPLGHYGDTMQEDSAYLSVLIHGIHGAKSSLDIPGFAEFEEGGGHERFPDAAGVNQGYKAVTYPLTYIGESGQMLTMRDLALLDGDPFVPGVTTLKGPKNCAACHTGNDFMTDGWKSNPTIEVCGSCHTYVDFATGDNHPTLGGAPSGNIQLNNDNCAGCHNPAFIEGIHDTTVTPNYITTIAITPDVGDATPDVYEEGDAPLITITVEDGVGADVGGYLDADYNATDNPTGTYNDARVYIYGPRSKAVPVLATGSTTDPAYDPAAGTPSQSHHLYVGGSDAQVVTDAMGFKYQTLAIPADMTPGTYMIMARIGVGADGDERAWAKINFQIGTDVEQEKVAGDGCESCHNLDNYESLHHRSYFGTDGCLACHDQSGNHAVPIANRVHAVHSSQGPDQGDFATHRDHSAITFPQSDVAEGEKITSRCVECHDSGNESYLTKPNGMACLGCHGSTPNAKMHMIQNGADLIEH